MTASSLSQTNPSADDSRGTRLDVSNGVFNLYEKSFQVICRCFRTWWLWAAVRGDTLAHLQHCEVTSQRFKTEGNILRQLQRLHNSQYFTETILRWDTWLHPCLDSILPNKKFVRLTSAWHQWSCFAQESKTLFPTVQKRSCLAFIYIFY